MRNRAMMLSIATAVLLAVLIWRLTTGGTPGMRTWAGAAVTIALGVAALLSWRQAGTTTVTHSSDNTTTTI